jgi:hypothetical protein
VVLFTLLFLLLRVLHGLGLLLRLAQGQHLDAPLPPGEVLVQHALWDAVLKLPWGDPAKPLVIDGDMANQLLLAQGR